MAGLAGDSFPVAAAAECDQTRQPDSPSSLQQHENGFEAFPEKSGLYDPENERDGCGVGFIVNIKGVPSHNTVTDALLMLEHMEHRGATGCEENTGVVPVSASVAPN